MTRSQRRAKWQRRQNQRLTRLENTLDTMRLEQAANSLLDRRQLFVRHFLAGFARGLGMVLGFAVLAAIIGYILTTAVAESWPQLAAWLEKLLYNINKRF